VDKSTGRTLSTIGSDGSPVGAPQFHPKLDQLAYDTYAETPVTGKKQWQIQVSDGDGTSPRVLVEHGRTPRWSPSGEEVAFSSYTDDFQTKVSRIGYNGEGLEEVSGKPHSTDFAWSPDGRSIAYEAIAETGYQLRKVDTGSGTERILSDGESGAYWDRTPVWSPNGKTIAFERRHRQFPAGSLWTVDPESGLEKQLFQRFADVVDPAYSPDGESIVFGSNHGGRGGLDLFRLDLDDLQVTQLTDLPGDEHSPSFSPDGNSLAFLNTDRRRSSEDRHRLHFRDAL
jgi:Tol biopolymer transport system component